MLMFFDYWHVAVVVFRSDKVPGNDWDFTQILEKRERWYTSTLPNMN